MVKKSLIVGLTAIILSLCCGLCFAAEGNNQTSINLGNEITKSVDKAGQSMQNLTDNAFSGNMVNEMKTDTENMGRSVTDEMNRVDDGIVNESRTNNSGDYNATRTTAEGTTGTTFNAMSTTTWMWIILAVAAIIIIAAIWYYATQNND